MASDEEINFEPLLAYSLDEEIKEVEEEIAMEFESIVAGGQGAALQKKSQSSTILNGHFLPVKVRPKIGDNLTGVALREISSAYKKKDTFVVIGKGSRILYRFGEAKRFVKSNGGWKNQAIEILTHGVFNYFLVFAIIINCIIYAAIPFEPPRAAATPPTSSVDSVPVSTSPQNQINYPLVTKITNYTFLTIFILEFTLKVLSRGLFKVSNPFSCLRILWNWLDIFVIVTAILSIYNPRSRTLAALNAIRALKLIPLIPSWLAGYDFLLRKAWRRIFHACIFGGVIMLLLGIVSTDLYYSIFRNKCVLNSTAQLVFQSGSDLTEDMFLKHAGSPEFVTCGNTSMSTACPADYICVAAGSTSMGGYVGFESLGVSELTLLNLVFQDFAEYVYEKIWITVSRGQLIYGAFVFFLGTFGIGALFYAVLGYAFLEGFPKLKLELDIKPAHEKSSIWSRRFDVTPTNRWGKWRESGRRTVTHKNFDLFVTLFIVADAVTLALDHHDNDGSTTSQVLRIITLIVYYVYCIEFVLKVVFIGIKPYFKSSWNRFDFAMVVLILAEFAFHIGIFKFGIMFTVLKFIPRWPKLNFIFQIMTKAIWVRWIFGITAITLFIYAYVGYVYFGENYTANTSAFRNSIIPRWNMVDFWRSLRITLRAFCGEWIETLWDLLLVSPAFPSIVFMTSSAIIGNFLVTCLSLGIMLTTYTQLSLDSDSDTKLTSLQRIFWPIAHMYRRIESRITGVPLETDSWADDESIQHDGFSGTVENEDTDAANEKVTNGKEEEVIIIPSQENPSEVPAPTLADKILAHFAYKLFVCTLIIVLTILVVYEELTAEIIFICYFGLEVITKVALRGFERPISLGILFDAMMVTNSVVALSTEIRYGLYNFGTFRLMMLVSRVTGLSLVRNQFWKQFRMLFQYFLATLFIWFVFALIGMTQFRGGFSQCFDGKYPMDDGEIETKLHCTSKNYTWKTTSENFDSVPNGLWTLFYVSARNGWLNPIQSGEDASNVDEKMKRDAFPAAMVYFIIFLIYGVLYPFSLMLGVLFKDFKQESWRQIFEQGWPAKCKPQRKTNSKTASFLDKYVNWHYFELWVCFTILVDNIAYANIQVGMSEELNFALDIVHLVVLVLFIFELIARVIALRQQFFKNWLCDLLLLIVLVSLVEVVVVDLVAKYFVAAGFLRILRLLHILALDRVGNHKIPEFGSFRKGLGRAFPVLSCIIAFYCLLYISFASFGTTTFTGVEDFGSWNATTSLFKIATISGMEGIYQNIAKGGDCDRAKDNETCGHPHMGVYYVAGFIAITVICFVNLYFALIWEIIEQLGQPNQNVDSDLQIEDAAANQPEDRENTAKESASL